MGDTQPSAAKLTAVKGRPQIILLGGIASLVAVAIHAPSLVWPTLVWDDFQILIRSWTWPITCSTLWEPANEHTMPLGRLTTWALVRLAGRPTALPFAAALQGPLAAVVAMWLVYVFIHREFGHPFYGLVAMVAFGVSSAYEQAVTWFAASFSVLALDTLLLSLLAAQRWRQTGIVWHLALSAIAAALAPAWFASGIVAGPLVTLYLLLHPRTRDEASAHGVRGFMWARLPALVPLAGSVAFLAASLPRTAERIMHLEHYSGQTALEAIRPLVGMEYTARALVDHVVPGTLGVTGLVCPLWLVPPLLCLLLAAGTVWWLRASDRRLAVLGVGFILAGYLLVYSARAAWDYEGMIPWTRYHLLPHLGLVLFICAGLPRWQERFGLQPTGALSRRQVHGVLLLTAALFACQFPRAVLVSTWRLEDYPKQQEVLLLIQQTDEICRARHIDRDVARQALQEDRRGMPTERLQLPDGPDSENGWDFLYGSPEPDPRVTVEEARRLLVP
jgi:hypothetical protein